MKQQIDTYNSSNTRRKVRINGLSDRDLVDKFWYYAKKYHNGNMNEALRALLNGVISDEGEQPTYMQNKTRC